METFYYSQVLKLKERVFSNEALYENIIKAKKFIDTHFSENIDLDVIASEAFYSKFHFIRTFKNIYGRTPYQHLISVRIEKAKELLESGQSVSEACIKVGFESTSSFSLLFKKITGLAPSTVKKQF